MSLTPNRHGARRYFFVSLFTLLVATALPWSAAAQTVHWIRQFGTAGANQARGVAADATGIYVVGSIPGALPSQTSAGGNDAFVRKYDANGGELWTRQFGTARADDALGVAVDSSGVYVAGRTEGTLPGQTSAGGFDAFVRKYDLNGNELWTRQFGSGTRPSLSPFDSAQAVAADSTGVYVAGFVSDTLPGQTALGGTDAFVRKYDPNGTELWTRQFGTASFEHAYAAAVDSTGVYVAGDWGQTETGSFDALVRKYDTNGVEQWTRRFGSPRQDIAFGAAADATGVYVVGETGGALTTVPNAGAEDAFVRKFDSNGSEIWIQQFGTAGTDRSFAAAVDGTGLYVGGVTTDALPGQTSFGVDAFIRKYDTDGVERGILQLSSSDDETARGVALDGTGLYVVGETGGPLPGETKVGLSDAYVLKMPTVFPCTYAISPVNRSLSTSRASGVVSISAPSGCAWTAASNSSFIALTSGGNGTGNSTVSYQVEENTTSNHRTGTLTIAGQTFTVTQAGTDGCTFSIVPTSRTVSADGESGTVTVTAPIGCVWTATSSSAFLTVTSGSSGTANGTVNYTLAANPLSFSRTATLTIAGESFGISQAGAPPGPVVPTPAINQGGVVSTASFAPSPAPVAPGSIATIFGSNLNSGVTVSFPTIGLDGRLATSLGGASVTINGVLAPLFYSAPGQLIVQIPFELAGLATATVQATVGAQTSVSRSISLDAFAPGIFTANRQGTGAAAALRQDNVTPVSAQNPARPNEIIVLYATGLGAVIPPLATGARSTGNPTVSTPIVTIDGIPGVVIFSGAAPGFTGLYQINVQIPASTRSASDIPVVLSIGGRQSNSVTIAVSP